MKKLLPEEKVLVAAQILSEMLVLRVSVFVLQMLTLLEHRQWGLNARVTLADLWDHHWLGPG